MSETSDNGVPDGIGLSAFEDAYDIQGELRGADDLRFFLARRRTSGVDAMITVVPAGVASENNALGLFAADVNLLSGVSHTGILQTIEGRWIDGGSFASVTERPRGGTVGERLASGERLDNPRVATLLREVNGSLEWARSIGVVHRGVNVDAMFFEPGTNRLEILLLPTPIAASGVPGAATDARTIGDLAWTLLAGHDPESDPRGASLATLRPDLPQQVVTQVEAMREATRDALPDVGAFIAVIATADVLKQAETDLEQRRAQLSDEERAHQEKLESDSERWRKRAIAAEELLAAQRASVASAPFVPTRPSVTRVTTTRSTSTAPRAKQIAIPIVVVAAIAAGAFALAHRQSQPTRVSEALPVDTTNLHQAQPTSPVVPIDSSYLRSAGGTVAPSVMVPPAAMPSGYAPPTPPASMPPGSQPSVTTPVAPVTPVPMTAIPTRPVDTTTLVTRPIPRRPVEPDTVAIDSIRMRENARLRDSLRARDTLRARDSIPPVEATRTRDSVRAVERRRCEMQPRDTIFRRDTTGRVDTILVKRASALRCDTIGPP